MDVIRQVRTFNADREPERLQMKHRRMRGDPFVLMRATFAVAFDDHAVDI
jgi:uncharacterized protein (DUF2252 family)